MYPKMERLIAIMRKRDVNSSNNLQDASEVNNYLNQLFELKTK